MSTTSFNVELNTDYQSAHRFPAWMALLVFSTISLAATASTLKDRGATENWVLSVTILSMILSFLAVLAYLMMRAVFVGQIPEGGLLGLLTLIWAAGLPVIMNPSRQIAVVNESGEGLVIINANLYFFSWLSLAAILYLTGSLLQEMAGVDVTRTEPKSARWFGLCASSVVVLASAVQALNDTEECDIDALSNSEYCRRTRLGIGVGTVSFFIAAAVTFLSQRGQLRLMMELIVTTLLLAMWCFGVGYITFGSTPGATISNLYFASWISFILAVFLFGQTFRETLAARDQQHAPDQQQQHGEEGGVGSNPVVKISEDPSEQL
jgi:hypothetical protein